jgi:mannosyltransferase
VIVSSVPLLLFLGAKSLWVDEGASYSIATLRFPTFWHVVSSQEQNQLLYFLALHAWVALGKSEFILRLPSALAMLGVVPLMWALARRLFGQWVALLTSILLITNAYLLSVAQLTRGYALGVLLAVASTYALVRAVDDGKSRWWVLYSGAAVLLLYVHIFGIFVLASQAISVAFLPSTHRPTRRLILAYLAIVLLLVPLIYWIGNGYRGQISWARFPSPRAVLGSVRRLTTGQPKLPGIVTWIAPVLYGLAVLVTGTILKKKVQTGGRSVDSWHYALVLSWAIFPAVASYGVSAVVPIFQYPYLVFSLPGLILTAAVGLVHLRVKLLTVVVSTLIVAVTAWNVVRWYTGPPLEDWRSAVEFVHEGTRPGDTIVMYAPETRAAFDYYVLRNDWQAAMPTPVYPAAGWESFSSVTFHAKHPDLAAALANVPTYPRVWVVLSHEAVTAQNRTELEAILRTVGGRMHRALRKVIDDHITVELWSR